MRFPWMSRSCGVVSKMTRATGPQAKPTSDHAGDVRDRPRAMEVVASRIIHVGTAILTFREDTVVSPGIQNSPCLQLVLIIQVGGRFGDRRPRARLELSSSAIQHSSGMKLGRLRQGFVPGGGPDRRQPSGVA